MTEIKVMGKSPAEAMELVRELRESGLTQGKDFDFSFHPATRSDKVPWNMTSERYTMFTFYEDKNATMFALKLK